MTTKPSLMRRVKATMLTRIHGMITCREFEEFVLRYLDGELPANTAKIFEWHLRVCRECRDYLAAYKRAIDVSKAVLCNTEKSLLQEVPEDLVKAILDAQKG